MAVFVGAGEDGEEEIGVAAQGALEQPGGDAIGAVPAVGAVGVEIGRAVEQLAAIAGEADAAADGAEDAGRAVEAVEEGGVGSEVAIHQKAGRADVAAAAVEG